MTWIDELHWKMTVMIDLRCKGIISSCLLAMQLQTSSSSEIWFLRNLLAGNRSQCMWFREPGNRQTNSIWATRFWSMQIVNQHHLCWSAWDSSLMFHQRPPCSWHQANKYTPSQDIKLVHKLLEPKVFVSSNQQFLDGLGSSRDSMGYWLIDRFLSQCQTYQQFTLVIPLPDDIWVKSQQKFLHRWGGVPRATCKQQYLLQRDSCAGTLNATDLMTITWLRVNHKTNRVLILKSSDFL